MSLVTQYKPGTFCWVDLATSDAKGAEQFYTALFDWTTEARPMGPDEFYVMCKRNGHYAAAFYQPAPEHSGGLPPHWKTYIAVADADATAKRAVELGGQVALEPMDVFTSGRMAVIIDPTGAMFCLWQPREHVGAGVINEPGSPLWYELMTRDTKAADEFYSGLFGWKSEARDMGHMIYNTFSNGDRPTGGMFQIPEGMEKMPPHWAVHFAASDIDASTAHACQLGGEVLMPPTDIPDVGRVAVLSDPQGAAFGILKLLREITS
ncbi:MAG: VOC family protein [Abitibacteriaceae bacterium]|nr:VOC family protein [Abditibacteriaceae bacterium]